MAFIGQHPETVSNFHFTKVFSWLYKGDLPNTELIISCVTLGGSFHTTRFPSVKLRLGRGEKAGLGFKTASQKNYKRNIHTRTCEDALKLSPFHSLLGQVGPLPPPRLSLLPVPT